MRPTAPAMQAGRTGSMQRARDGSVLWWGDPDTPAPGSMVPSRAPVPVTVAVSPVLPGHTVAVDYRVDGGPIRKAVAVPRFRKGGLDASLFRALLPGQPSGVVEFLPVLHFAGQPISSRLAEAGEFSSYEVTPAARPPGRTSDADATSLSVRLKEPCWAWDADFVISIRVTLEKQPVGPVPDGFRINWCVREGQFVGPGVRGVMLPGIADHMLIRRDGVAIIDVKGCLQTESGGRALMSYSGICDLGAHGYARALRGEFSGYPPVVVTPVFETADKQLTFLNRAQCIGVGRVDTAAVQYEFDVYRVQVGERQRRGQPAFSRGLPWPKHEVGCRSQPGID